MSTWAEFERQEPVFAGRVRELFASHRHHTMATLRRDGSPRISGTEVDFGAGELDLGMMGGARRAADLRHDPRVAVHSHTVDPPPEEADAGKWCGDAKVAGTARGVGPPDPEDGSHRFRVEVGEVVLTRVGEPPDHLLIEVWRPGAGLVRIERR